MSKLSVKDHLEQGLGEAVFEVPNGDEKPMHYTYEIENYLTGKCIATDPIRQF